MARNQFSKTPPPCQALIGQTFGWLEVIGITRRPWHGGLLCECRCKCGQITAVRSDHLKRGFNVSCGCNAAMRVSNRTSDGKPFSWPKSDYQLTKRNGDDTKSGSYKIWVNIKYRCHNPHSRNYHLYGGRGIRVCDRWIDSFANFVADMGPRPNGTSIDRIDPNGNYEPINCRWATTFQQANNRRNNLRVTIGNVTKTFTEWCHERGIDLKKARNRYSQRRTPAAEVIEQMTVELATD